MKTNRLSARLNLTRLEERETPVPLVNAVLSGGTLTVIGSDSPVAEDNQHGINIFMSGNNLVVAGMYRTAVAGKGGTPVVSGVSMKFDPAAVRALTIKTGLGHDFVTLSGLNIAGAVTINGGSGGNSVRISDGGRFGSLSITNTDGSDSLEIGGGGAKYTIAGALTVNNGTGGSQTRLGMFPGDEVTIGSVSIQNSSGTDVVSATGASLTVGGMFSVNNGRGGNGVYAARTSGVFLASGKLTLNGSLNVTSSSGVDEVRLGDEETGSVLAAKAITLSLGNGAGRVSVNGNGTLGSLSLTGGADFDSLHVTSAGGLLTVAGSMIFTGGDSDDLLRLGEAGGSISISGSLTANMGDGDDEIDINGVQVGGTTTLSTEVGSDNVAIDDAVFLGAVNVSMGADDDSIFIEQGSSNSAAAVFKAAVTINFGSGDDWLAIDTSRDGGVSFARLSVDGGGDLDQVEAGRNVSFGVGLGLVNVESRLTV